MAALEMLTAWPRNYLDADFWDGFRAKSKLTAADIPYIRANPERRRR
jgi:hypothetical protein